MIGPFQGIWTKLLFLNYCAFSLDIFVELSDTIFVGAEYRRE